LNWSPVEEDGSYRWPPYRSEQEWRAGHRPLTDWPGDAFAHIRSMGFDFVRLSVDPGPLLASRGAKRQQALDILAAAVERVTSAGLKVVFDLHGVTQVPAYSMEMIYDGADSEGVASYREMVVAVAAMLARVGTDKVALEPYNEPAYYPCDSSGSDDWQRIMADTVRDIRAVSSELTIVATGACGGSIAGLVNLAPGFDDPNVYYSFHMYEP
ncbi:MAG: glycoside hydrolase family 5 protein, partial [Mesorhizobium sp.]